MDYYAALILADYSLFILHTALVLLSVVGWAFKRTRVLQLIAMVATAFSWFVVGPLRHGQIGFCICTELQAMVRAPLTARWPTAYPFEQNFITALVKAVSGYEISVGASEAAAGIVFALVTLATIITWTWLGLKHRRARRAAQQAVAA